MQVLGPDLWNGSQAQLTQFKNTTGVTFPLLRNGASGSGNENLWSVYGHYDNFVIINKQGIIRYNAFDLWPHGNRYHLNELRATVDSLVSTTVDVGDAPGVRAFLLNARPNPFREVATFELTNPRSDPIEARVTVHDMSGRRIATVWEGLAPRGITRAEWRGRDRSGGMVAPGIYRVRAGIGDVTLDRRVVFLR